jgi:hypothetical protein
MLHGSGVFLFGMHRIIFENYKPILFRVPVDYVVNLQS